MKISSLLKNQTILIAAALAVVIFFSRNAVADKIESSNSEFDRYDAAFKAAAAKYGISNWLWIKAIAWNESSVGQAASVKRGIANPTDAENSKSSDGKSWGIMQVTLTTAQDLKAGTTVADLNTPSISIDLGAKYISQMLKRYGGDLYRAVRAYNQGPGNEDKRKPYADGYLTKFQTHLAKLAQMTA